MNENNNKTALLIIDMQNDFVTGGSLDVDGSLDIIPIINNIRKQYKFDFTVFSQDFHPEDHISFKCSPIISQVKDEDLDETTRPYKGAFPAHCVQGTLGAEFHKELDVSNPDLIVQKGQNKLVDSFSAFGNPELNTFLQSKGVGTVYVCGLCYDFCVGSTAVDAAKHGLSTYVLLNASRAVSVPTTTVMEGLFSKHLVKVINSSEIKQ